MSEALRIWAPRAQRVDVVIGEHRIAAEREHGGWWRGPALANGTDYLISLDGGPSRPDPRSRYQPLGPDGPSRWIDVTSSAHAFRAPVLSDAVIYELHVGTFTNEGTFSAIADHLDHLVQLGVTHVELMPIAQFPGRHGWGYDGVNLYAPHAAYGGPDGLRALVAELHARNLAVIVDVVHNHFGPEGAYLDEFGPYRTDRHATPWGRAMNVEAREVRRYLIESAKLLVREYGVDGLRLDAVHSIYDDGERHFVADLVDEVHALQHEIDRPLVLIGEYDDHDPRAITPQSEGGWGLDAHWNDDFHHALHALLTREHHGYYADFALPCALPKVLEHGYALDGCYSGFRGTHHGIPYGARPRDRLVAYIQSHDQIGNRPFGERLHHLCGLERAKISAAILLTSPFVPMLFQGEEWAASTPFQYFADLQSTALRDAVRAGRRAEHAIDNMPDPFAPQTRDASVLRWSERTADPHRQMLTWYRELVSARHTYPALRDGRPFATRVESLDAGRGMTIVRGELALHCNFSIEPLAIAGAESLLLASQPLATHRELPPLSCALARGSI